MKPASGKPPPSAPCTGNSASDLSRWVEEATSTGSPELDAKSEPVKKIKTVAKRDSDSLVPLVRVVVDRLHKPHSQVRLSAFQLLDHLFQRSHVVRHEVVHKFIKDVAELSMGIEQALPAPKEAADKLKKDAIQTIKSWVEKFGHMHMKLKLAYNYLKEVKKVDFQALEARNEALRRAAAEKQRQQERLWTERVRKVREEMQDKRFEIEDCHTQLRNCIDLLVDNYFQEDNAEDNDEDEEEVEDGNLLRRHGIVTHSQQHSVSIAVPSTSGAGPPQIEKTADNEAIFENLKGQVRLLRNSILPMVKKWSIIVTKASGTGLNSLEPSTSSGTFSNTDTLKKIIDLKQLLEDVLEKAEVIQNGLKEQDRNDSDTDDDDFVEVPSLEEEAQLQPANALGIPFFRTASSSSTGSESDDTKAKKNSSSNWQLGKKSTYNEADDPTTLSATLSKLKKDSLVEAPGTSGLQRSGSSSAVPKISLEHLERRSPQKVAIDPEKLRFWGGSSSQEAEELLVPGSDSTARSIEYTGTFEPVKWSCRAPLPSGRLCPRMDRVKCPLHGKIIPRDNKGEPSNIEDKIRLDEERMEEKAKNPDWQDPKLLAEIKASTGIDLKMPPKRGEKGKKGQKKKKYPGLVDLKEAGDTVRKRLEKRVFNKASIKRVAATLNKLDRSKQKEKYGDQFNYVFS